MGGGCAGQFGSVYKAVRAGVQDVAVKFLHRTNAEDLTKFIEVRTLSPFSIKLCSRQTLSDVEARAMAAAVAQCFCVKLPVGR